MLLHKLTGNYQYSACNTENLSLPIKIELSLKLKTFYWVFIAFFKSTLNMEHFQKKKKTKKKTKQASWLKYFWSYWLRRKSWLKCLKGLVSENPFVVNVLGSPKNCLNLQKSTFILVSFHFQKMPGWKNHFLSDIRF